jgi:hypothetical protein
MHQRETKKRTKLDLDHHRVNGVSKVRVNVHIAPVGQRKARNESFRVVIVIGSDEHIGKMQECLLTRKRN